MYTVITTSLSIESEVDTSHLHVIRPATVWRKIIILLSQKMLNPVEIIVNIHEAHALINPWAINGDIIVADFCSLRKFRTKDMDTIPLETAIRGRTSSMRKKRTVELNIRGNDIRSTIYVTNLQDWYAILTLPSLAALHVIMSITNNMVSIQPTGKLR